MSDKPKRWKGKEVYNLHNPENDPSYAGGLLDGVEANDRLIDWLEQRIKRLENDVLYHTQEHDNLSEEAEEDEQRIAELETEVLLSKPLYSRRKLEARIAELEKALETILWESEDNVLGIARAALGENDEI